MVKPEDSRPRGPVFDPCQNQKMKQFQLSSFSLVFIKTKRTTQLKYCTFNGQITLKTNYIENKLR